MACTSGCPTPGLHASWGECARAKRMQVAGVEAHQKNKAMHKGLDDYVAARRAGLQPDGVFPAQVAKARKITDETGVPYRADKVA